MMSQPKTPPHHHAPARAACSRLEAAYQRLKQDIQDGVYTPRQHLVETDVAKALGVSRATLRAALIRLRHEGFVEIQPNRGAQVRSFSVEEATRILQVREVLEGLAAAMAAKQATPEHLAELRSIVAEMEKTLAADNFLAYLPLVGRFHQVIVAAADNEFIHQCLGMLHAPLIRHQFRIILVPGRKDESLAEHRDILIAMEQRDAVRAEQAMRRHVAQLCHALQHASRLPIG